MASHEYHPDSHEHGLADGCARCREHSEHPFETLDDRMLLALYERTLLWRVGARGGEARSENEGAAMRIVETALLWRLQLDKLDAARAKREAA